MKSVFVHKANKVKAITTTQVIKTAAMRISLSTKRQQPANRRDSKTV